MMRLLAALFALVLAGCATETTIQRVEIPVPVSCVERGQIPAQPADRFAATQPTDPIDEQVRALLIDRDRRREYGDKLRAIVESCVKP